MSKSNKRHFPSPGSSSLRDAHDQQRINHIKTDEFNEELDHLFSRIVTTDITTCSTNCPMYLHKKSKNGTGICTALGIKAPLGGDCIAQKISKER